MVASLLRAHLGSLFLFTSALLLLAGCGGTPKEYRQIDVTTPAGNTTAMVGVYSPPEMVPGPDGKMIPKPERPFHMVPREISTPGGTRTVYVRQYE